MEYKVTIKISADDVDEDFEGSLRQVLIPSLEGIMEGSDYQMTSIELSKEYHCPLCDSTFEDYNDGWCPRCGEAF